MLPPQRQSGTVGKRAVAYRKNQCYLPLLLPVFLRNIDDTCLVQCLRLAKCKDLPVQSGPAQLKTPPWPVNVMSTLEELQKEVGRRTVHLK